MREGVGVPGTGIRITSACRILASLPTTLHTFLGPTTHSRGYRAFLSHSLSFHWAVDALLTCSLLALATRGRRKHESMLHSSDDERLGAKDHSPVYTGKARTKEEARRKGKGREDRGEERGTQEPRAVTEAL